MSTQNNNVDFAKAGKFTKPQLPVVNLKNKIKLTIPEHVVEQVKYLCSRIWEVEWSGVLFYTPIGDFGKENFEIKAEHILLMDKGSSAYTEFETDEGVTDFMMSNPQYLMMNRGLVHL